MQCVDSKFCASLWGSDDVGWAFLPAVGLSGGIISLCNKAKFESDEVRIGSNFVTVRGKWTSYSEIANIMNVYSPCDLVRKRLFWDEAKNDWVHHSGDMWCVVGDFNAIVNNDKRVGSAAHFAARECSEFSKFIEDLKLFDLPLAGSKFTWFLSNGSAMSRLDRFLVNNNWLNCWEQITAGYQIQDSVSSLKRNGVVWRYLVGVLISLKKKLKSLKRSLKIWNRDVFGLLDRKISDKVSIINSIDGKGSACALNGEDIAARRIAYADLWRLLSQKDSLLLQKSRQRWLRDGDSNTQYFHASINRRRRSNEVLGMPSLDGIVFNRITEEDDNHLIVQFKEDEIKEAVWSCEGEKSPGPDGYNFTFIKKIWDCVKNDVFAMVDDFFISGNLAKGCISSFIVLIPKTGSPLGLGDYRPISLVGCIYKIISKLLTGRIKKVMHLIISYCQYAFIKGRCIMDGVVIVNEVIDQGKKKNYGDCFIFKVDFEKAYDCVNWSFLLYMMERMGFCLKWRTWIKSCLQSNFTSILVNGNPTAEFNMTRGLRQGDPIAPFLFLIVAEGLAGIIRSAVSQRIFKGYSVDLPNHKAKMHCGLTAPRHTESLLREEHGIRCGQLAANKLLCGVGALPFKFLGIPVGANPRRISTWGPVIEVFKKKLSFWQQKLISFAGRVTLLKSVLSSLPIYFFSFYKAPVSVIHELDKIQRIFLWGRSEVALDKNAYISSMGEWRNNVWYYNLEWRRLLFSWEKEEVDALLNSIKDVRILQDSANGWL
ncbi:PREDICTED: uncharacterized protein LOC109363522 [Lupinus angustifolius]|uniref:uncharacterized protein LOC109363522 n=1 Tax=Lupinus angustifolius TaxID=3871 RepID=UPI00092E6112|nr:PREDICTED: uncharacterized protein LOC109363522 [Lupinus angustifolius]